MMFLRFMLLFLFLSAGQVWAQVSSGDYEGLLIGADPSSKIITGYYENFTGMDQASGKPLFSCIFYLRGTMEGDPPYKIETWFPGDKTRSHLIAGTLIPEQTDGTSSLRIGLKTEHGGCWNVQHFADKEGAVFSLDASGKWSAIRVISSAKAYFHSEPADAKKRKAYVVRGNPVRILESKPGWVNAEYSAEGKTTTGWLKEPDLFSAEPPAR
jgi:hypothetical protein